MIPGDQILAALMFAGMIAFLFLGFPVAFSLTFTGFFFGGVAVAAGYLAPNFIDILPLRIWGTMTNFTLLAVPLFVFLYLKLQGRESWLFSAVFAAAVSTSNSTVKSLKLCFVGSKTVVL